MIDTLATFADQVTTVAREVGVQGKLGGQAAVPGAAGTWKDLTDNVNQLAANLTTQVRAIAEVATAVTQGDLTRSIQVQVQGELEELKNNINEMIRNLKETTLKNAEQDWLKGNLARFTRMLQGQRDLLTVGRMILSELAPLVGAKHGVFYTMTEGGGDPHLVLLASYAFQIRKNVGNRFLLGEGLVGQAALEKERILLTHVPPHYVQHLVRPGRGRPAQHRGASRPLRGPGEGGHRARLVRGLQQHAPHLPRAAHREHRDRPQHHPGQHPHRGPAAPVAVPRRRAPEPAEGAPADERAARGEGAAAGRPEHRGRAEEPGGRAGATGARGEGRTARPHLEVQVRVPREHVPRAAHAAQQPAHPRGPAGRERPGQPHRATGGVRADDPSPRAATCSPSSTTSSTSPRSSRARSRWSPPSCPSPTSPTPWSGRSGTSPRPRASPSASRSTAACPGASARTASGSCRS